MKKFYISQRQGESGIYKYSCDFYDLILKQQGYIFLNSSTPLPKVLRRISAHDKVHIETGIFLEDEKKILFTLIKKGYTNISVTLHDAPLIRFPFFSFKNRFLNDISKFYDRYINNFNYQKKFLKKIACIYVLTHKGLELMQKKYQLNNLHYLPHLINKEELKLTAEQNRNFIYLGYIGKNKGIEYSLQLHQTLLQTFPDVKFYIIGKPLGKQRIYYEQLKRTYKNQTCFMGYVPDSELSQLFACAEYSFLLFKDYDFYIPFSGSILHALKMGKLVFTNNVNATSELITNFETGFFLSENLEDDIATITKVFRNNELKKKVKNQVYNKLFSTYTSEQVSMYISEAELCNN